MSQPRVPLFNAYGFYIGTIPVSEALEKHGSELELRAKGNGARRHFSSAKLYARVSNHWAPRMSAGFLVMQLLTD